MAYSSILGADTAPVQPSGRDSDALGPSDNSDSGVVCTDANGNVVPVDSDAVVDCNDTSGDNTDTGASSSGSDTSGDNLTCTDANGNTVPETSDAVVDCSDNSGDSGP